ncbi:MAG: nitrate reductase cytochrome c-type subunit [Thiotrichaceae bacterium]|nr:nitrate reductase cytochrome c-type subunit [Thiotrichaceae bacterium]
MKRLLSFTLANLLLLSMTATVYAEDEKEKSATSKPVKIVSLRGDHNNDKLSAEFPERKIIVEEGGIDVTFDDQPPMIPHESDDIDKISLTENSCLTCHSKETYKKEKAPKPTATHYVGRKGKKTAKLAPNRYFCTQCHVLQQDKKALVENNFESE